MVHLPPQQSNPTTHTPTHHRTTEQPATPPTNATHTNQHTATPLMDITHNSPIPLSTPTSECSAPLPDPPALPYTTPPPNDYPPYL
jgi:hypothetical protein